MTNAPATSHTSYVAVQAPGPHRITVETGGDGPIGVPGAYFKFWESFVFNRIMARLSGGEVRLFVALAAHRQRDGVLSIASEAALCDFTKRSLVQLRSIRRTLCTRENGTICRHHGGDVYELMPNEPLLGRRPVSTIEPTGPRWALAGEPHPDGKPSPHDGKPSLVMENHRAVSMRNARASRDQNQENKIIVEKSDDDDAVRLLCEAGFNVTDARRLIARTQADLETVRTAIANTRYKASIGDLRNARAYIARQLQNGCTLFSAIQQKHDAATRNRDRLARLIEAFGTPDDAADAQAWFYGLSTSEQATAIRGFESRMADADLWRVIRPRITAARQRAGGGA